MSIARAQLKEKKKLEEKGFYCGNMERDHKMPLPEVNKIYTAYDDGKISPSREYKVKILDILTYKQLPKEIKKLWKEEVVHYFWLFSPKSDYFIKAVKLKVDGEEEQWFVRTHGNTWFGLNSNSDGWCSYCGELDVDGSLRQSAESLYNSYCK